MLLPLAAAGMLLSGLHGSALLPLARLPRCFQINAAGHILVCQAFAPLLVAAARENGATE